MSSMTMTSTTLSKGVSEKSSPSIAPLHDPSHQAKVIQQQNPLGVANPNPIVPGQTTDPSLLNGAAGLGQKALLAKKFAKANKATVSPTDQIQSPCTAKLAGAKQRHFAKGKPASLAQSFTALRESSGPTSGVDF
ncbi:MAG: hypothetical protein TREMPRED_001195 [Tremellales sp. Tagirdzhanova-0007]|nr:MAG: hypothetical protein TREMPRED_001195 [Tremellales sp. Tagirdzhanova-0007]